MRVWIELCVILGLFLGESGFAAGDETVESMRCQLEGRGVRISPKRYGSQPRTGLCC